MAIKYKNKYEIVNPKYISKTNEPKFSECTGNGLRIRGMYKGEEYFIKRNTDIKNPPKSDTFEAASDTRKKYQNHVRKQKKIQEKMAGLQSIRDRIVVEEEHFDDGSFFVTITKIIHDVLPNNHDFTSINQKQFISLGIELIKLLAEIHKRDIIHGDLKEANILVKPKGSDYLPYLIDFDLSYIKNDIPTPEELGGSEYYRSPEYFLYKTGSVSSKVITPATDIFTFAIVYHRWWTGKDPTIEGIDDPPEIGEEIGKGGKVIVNDKFDIEIGKHHKETLSNLIYWMLENEHSKRPTADQVQNVLSDNLSVPDYYHKNFDMNLWIEHEPVAQLLSSITELKKKNVKAFGKDDSSGHKYKVILNDNIKRILSIEQIISSGYAYPKTADICKPWGGHEIEMQSPDNIFSLGYRKIEQASSNKYKLTTTSGTTFIKEFKFLLSEKLAKLKEPTGADVCKPWHIHNIVMESAMNVLKMGYKKIEQASGYKYKITTTSGLSFIKDVKWVISEKIATEDVKSKTADVCKPWSFHSIKMVSPDEVFNLGYKKIEQIATDMYKITYINGFSHNVKFDWLISKKLAIEIDKK